MGGPDVARAEQLLREAGVRSVPLTLYYPAGRDTSAEGTKLRIGSDSGPEATVLGFPWRSKDKPR